MKKLYTFFALLCATMLLAQAGAPAAPYWNGFNFNQTGKALKNSLAAKISATHTNTLSYSEVWEALKFTDQDPDNTANVLLIYGFGSSRSRSTAGAPGAAGRPGRVSASEGGRGPVGVGGPAGVGGSVGVGGPVGTRGSGDPASLTGRSGGCGSAWTRL